jgi:WD40 repeat protein
VVEVMVEFEDGKFHLHQGTPTDRQVSPPVFVLTIVDAGAVSVLEGHTNCIWSLAAPGTQQPLLASAAADTTVKIWDTRINSRSPLRASFKHGGNDKSNPTCVSWDWEGRGIIIGWEHSAVEIWDVEIGRAVTNFEPSEFGTFLTEFSNSDSGKTQVNCLVKHPTETLIIAGYEDRNIRIFDTRTRMSFRY